MTMTEYARINDLDGPGGDYFSAACGLYWYCNDWHGGQGDTLYALQCQLGYKPGGNEYGPEAESTDAEIYTALEAGELDAEDVYQWIQDQIAERNRQEASE